MLADLEMFLDLFFQIPEARTQAIFADCQLHIWAVEGEMIYAVDTHIQRPIWRS